MASNIVTLSRFPPILARLGVRRYVLQGLTDYNEASGAGRVSAISDGRRQFQLLLAACRQAGVEPVAHPHCLETEVGDDGPAWARSERSEAVEQTRLCSLPWEIPFIDKDGGVYPCCYAASQSAGRLGELQRETLADIWSGPRYQQFRGDLLDGRTTPGICRQCTKVPLGEHLLRRYAARLLPGQSILRGTTTLRLAVQNVGSRAWTSADRVRIGTANPRDHGSAYATAGWLSANRVTSFDEHRVDPGATATFQFSIQSAATLAFDTFQLVVDGQCWMPNTRFKVSAHES
jgi:radical SAM protein with 4Fe4S-binding SPASM domain